MLLVRLQGVFLHLILRFETLSTELALECFYSFIHGSSNSLLLMIVINFSINDNKVDLYFTKSTQEVFITIQLNIVLRGEDVL